MTASAADRRGRRAAWVAAGITLIAIVLAFVRFGDDYARHRYLELREHRMRADRFGLEEVVERVTPRTGAVTLVVSVDDLRAADLSESGSFHTLDSLRALGRRFDTTPPGSLAAGPSGAADAWIVEVLIRPHVSLGSRGAGVSGRPLSAAERERLAPLLTTLIDTPPGVTSYRVEGDAAWVSRCALDALTQTPSELSLVLWVRYTELLPPGLPQRRFPADSARESELEAIDHYLGRLLEGLRRAAGEHRGPTVFLLSHGAITTPVGLIVEPRADRISG